MIQLVYVSSSVQPFTWIRPFERKRLPRIPRFAGSFFCCSKLSHKAYPASYRSPVRAVRRQGLLTVRPEEQTFPCVCLTFTNSGYTGPIDSGACTSLRCVH